MYFVHDAHWDASPAGALASYAILNVRPFENGELGQLESHRVRAPLTITSRANVSYERAHSAITQMRDGLERLLERAHPRADEDEREAIETYLERGTIPILGPSTTTRRGKTVWKARIPYPSIRSLNITKDEVLEPLEGVFLTGTFSPRKALERYLTGAYALVEIDDERGIVVPTGRRAPESLLRAQMMASDIETYDPNERAQIPENVRENVLSRVETSERAYLEKAPQKTIWRRYQELEGHEGRRILMAQTAGRHGVWVGHVIGTNPPHENLAVLARDHDRSLEDAVIIAGHTIGSDLTEWKQTETEPFGTPIRTKGRVAGYQPRYTLEGRVVLDTEHHARAAYPSLRSHDLESVAHLIGEHKTLEPNERRDRIRRALQNDPEALRELESYAREDVRLAHAIAEHLLPTVVERSRIHNLTIEELAGASERKLSERFVERHRWLYAKRPHQPGREKRRFDDEKHDWTSFSLREHTRRLLTIEATHGIGDVTILALHPYQRALEPLLSEVASVRDAYARRAPWVRSDLEPLCSYPVFLLRGANTEPRGKTFRHVFERDPDDLIERIERAENQLRGMLEHTRVYAASSGLIAIQPHDALERGLEQQKLATRLARGSGFVSNNRVIVSDTTIHAVGTSDVRRTSIGDYSREERDAIGTFEDTLITRGPDAALEALSIVAARTPPVIVRSDTAKRHAYEYQPSARSERVKAHRDFATQPGDRVEIGRLSGLWESERLTESLRSAFHGLEGSQGLNLIESYLSGNELARMAIASNPKRQ